MVLRVGDRDAPGVIVGSSAIPRNLFGVLSSSALSSVTRPEGALLFLERGREIGAGLEMNVEAHSDDLLRRHCKRVS